MGYFVLVVKGQLEFCRLSWEQVVDVHLGRNDTEVDVFSQRKKREEHDKKGGDCPG
jgi:hypothetical protein